MRKLKTLKQSVDTLLKSDLKETLETLRLGQVHINKRLDELEKQVKSTELKPTTSSVLSLAYAPQQIWAEVLNHIDDHEVLRNVVTRLNKLVELYNSRGEEDTCVAIPIKLLDIQFTVEDDEDFTGKYDSICAVVQHYCSSFSAVKDHNASIGLLYDKSYQTDLDDTIGTV